MSVENIKIITRQKYDNLGNLARTRVLVTSRMNLFKLKSKLYFYQPNDHFECANASGRVEIVRKHQPGVWFGFRGTFRPNRQPGRYLGHFKFQSIKTHEIPQAISDARLGHQGFIKHKKQGIHQRRKEKGFPSPEPPPLHFLYHRHHQRVDRVTGNETTPISAPNQISKNSMKVFILLISLMHLSYWFRNDQDELYGRKTQFEIGNCMQW